MSDTFVVQVLFNDVASPLLLKAFETYSRDGFYCVKHKLITTTVVTKVPIFRISTVREEYSVEHMMGRA